MKLAMKHFDGQEHKLDLLSSIKGFKLLVSTIIETFSMENKSLNNVTDIVFGMSLTSSSKQIFPVFKLQNYILIIKTGAMPASFTCQTYFKILIIELEKIELVFDCLSRL
jgi:heme/copper-type cytochrome/quinol oxidase subunit 3